MIIRANGRTFLDGSNEINPPALTDYQKDAIKGYYEYVKETGDIFSKTSLKSLSDALIYGEAKGAVSGFMRALEILGIPCKITDAGEIEF